MTEMHKSVLRKFPNVRLKLNQKNNVIIAECDGMPTEMFMPVINDEGNINIININPQKRCSCIETSHIVAKKESLRWRYSSRQTNESQNQPLHSTPENFKNSINKRSIAESFQSIPSFEVYNDETLPSPEQIREAIPENIRNLQHFRNLNTLNKNTTVLNNEFHNEPINVSATGLNDKPFDELVISEITTSFNNEVPNQNISIIDWPCSLSNKSIHTESEESTSVQWRKVLTPIRTYSRFKYSPNNSTSPLSKKIYNNSLENSVQGFRSKKSIIHKKMYKCQQLDEKILISPKSFKNQFQYKKAEKHEMINEIRSEYENFKKGISKKNAFILLTTPLSNQRCFSQKLQEQFRERCLNKGSSTYPKYKKLASLSNKTMSSVGAHTVKNDVVTPLPSPSLNTNEYTIISTRESLD